MELGRDSDTGGQVNIIILLLGRNPLLNQVSFLLVSCLSVTDLPTSQVKYVVELARALSMMPGVYRVDLFTRQVFNKELPVSSMLW